MQSSSFSSFLPRIRAISNAGVTANCLGNALSRRIAQLLSRRNACAVDNRSLFRGFYCSYLFPRNFAKPPDSAEPVPRGPWTRSIAAARNGEQQLANKQLADVVNVERNTIISGNHMTPSHVTLFTVD